MYKCTCNDCGRNFTTFDPSWWCDDCRKKRFQKRQDKKTKTNADRIRAMSDEELAVFLRDVEYDVEQYPFIQDWDKWLKQPAEVE